MSAELLMARFLAAAHAGRIGPAPAPHLPPVRRTRAPLGLDGFELAQSAAEALRLGFVTAAAGDYRLRPAGRAWLRETFGALGDVLAASPAPSARARGEAAP